MVLYVTVFWLKLPAANFLVLTGRGSKPAPALLIFLESELNELSRHEGHKKRKGREKKD